MMETDHNHNKNLVFINTTDKETKTCELAKIFLFFGFKKKEPKEVSFVPNRRILLRSRKCQNWVFELPALASAAKVCKYWRKIAHGHATTKAAHSRKN